MRREKVWQPRVIKLYSFYAHRSMLKTVAVPRLYRRHFSLTIFIPRVQEPAAIRPSGFPSLTSSKLFTPGITQASLDLLSLNRNFQTPSSIER